MDRAEEVWPEPVAWISEAGERVPVYDRTAMEAYAAEKVEEAFGAIPEEIAEQVLSMGRVEWGATREQTSQQHIEDFAETLRLTRKHFNLEDVPIRLHGLYLEGTETVLCHTGTSPNSPSNAMALAGVWNWLHGRCANQHHGGNDAD